MILAITVLLIFMAADHYLTWRIIYYGGVEQNWLIRLILKLKVGPWIWAGLKLSFATYLAVWSSTYYAWWCAVIFGLVCLWNYVQIRRAQ